LLLRDSGPWGQQFSEPLFKGRFFLISQHIVGKNHLKLKLSVDGKQDKQLDAIAFNVDLNVWPDYKNKQVEVVYKLNINSWQGSESLQLMIEHFA